ncbi:rod shape-determining protein MreC [Clostridiaceae bacterium HSG29]|nr:rod shape-determining protein MreC [Clostridiaceae bacterium HSG29]
MDKRLRNLIIILSGIILLVSIGYSNGGRTSVTIIENLSSNVIVPAQKILFNISDSTSNKIDSITEIFKNKKKIEFLREENKKLNSELIELSLTNSEFLELSSLKDNLNYISENHFENHVTCNVISKDMGNWFDVFSINAGSQQGVKKYSVVISSEGLIGKVYEVGNNYSKVISVIDNRSNISFETISINSKYQGFIRSSENGLLFGNLFDPNATTKIGEKIITTGQGIYPKGILIGEIIAIEDNKDEFLKEITVKPCVDFKNINIVTVITMDQEKSEWINEN